MSAHNLYPFGVQPIPAGRVRFRNGMSTRLQTDRSETRIRVDVRDGSHGDVNLSKSGDTVQVDRWGTDQDVQFRKQGQNIEIDRFGIYNDLNILRNSHTVKIDRPGNSSDVSASFSANQIEIRNPEPQTTTVLRRRGDEVQVHQHGFLVESFPVSLFPGGWPARPSLLAVSEYIGMPPQTADALDRWSAEGVDMDDLVRVDKYGQVTTYDQNFI